MPYKLTKFAVIGTIMFCVIGCTQQLTETSLTLREQLAQKIMLDIRYFCADQVLGIKAKCNQAVTELPDEIAHMISKTGVGGVILFAENLKSVPQITKLTEDLQQAAAVSKAKVPLFISVDQEGGRVARLPRQIATSFSGAMAIGATYAQYGDYYATETGRVIGTELAALGFNVNHAPTVDVNVNPENPVINVRSFSERAKVVAELAAAQMRAMQSANIIATLKHFPGHGDTAVDSHTGLPVVNHDLATVEDVDLKPFQQAIDAGLAKMIMTAHIQYPHLDSSTFETKNGETQLKPATMSRTILTDLLRGKMGFDGVVITDALDMAGISHYFDKTSAVIETFKAGADIALMPFYIRSPADLHLLDKLLDELEQAVISGALNAEEINQSVLRILTLKSGLPQTKQSLEQKTTNANTVLANLKSKELERELADKSIVQLSNQGVLPISAKVKVIHFFMPDQAKCQAMYNALETNIDWQVTLSCTSMLEQDPMLIEQQLDSADLVIVGNITPQQSPVELGGLEDIAKILPLLRDKKALDQQLLYWLKQAKSKGKETVFVSLRTPYEMSRYAPYANATLATFAYNTYQDKQGQYHGSTYQALARVISGKIRPEGVSPVSVGN